MTKNVTAEKFNDEEEEEEKENEINALIIEDNIEQIKAKLVNHLINQDWKNKKDISLIEKCAFCGSMKCLNFLLEGNVFIDRHKKDGFEFGLMEYGALKGNKDIVNFCLEKGQEIKKETLVLGLMGHHNELVEWMIKEGKRRRFFDETIETKIFGYADNIEFIEKLLKSGIDVNVKDND